MDIVLKLRELRRMRRLSQKAAGRASGLSDKTISSFETGARIDSMKLGQLFALLAAYRVTPADFFGDTVEEMLFSELEGLSDAERAILRELRRLPEPVRERAVERIAAFLSGAAIGAEL